MSRPQLLLPVFLVSTVPCLAFLCGPMPGPIRERLPDAKDPRTAVFVGRVEHVSAGAATLRIVEAFTGPQPGTELELETRIAESIRFVPGVTYLVEAWRGIPTNPWTTTICDHTRRIEAAGADLIALRAWKSGRTLPCDLAGSFFGRDESQQRSGNVVELAGKTKTFRQVSDGQGKFNFKNVPFGAYTIRTVQLGWGTQPVEITDRLCPTITIYFDR